MGPFSAYATAEGTNNTAAAYTRIGVNTLAPYVHGQLMYMKMEFWMATANYALPNRLIVQLGNAGGLNRRIMQAYGIAYAALGANSIGDLREIDYRNGIGGGIPITSNDVDIWVSSVDCNFVTMNCEFVVWIP